MLKDITSVQNEIAQTQKRWVIAMAESIQMRDIQIITHYDMVQLCDKINLKIEYVLKQLNIKWKTIEDIIFFNNKNGSYDKCNGGGIDTTTKEQIRISSNTAIDEITQDLLPINDKYNTCCKFYEAEIQKGSWQKN